MSAPFGAADPGESAGSNRAESGISDPCGTGYDERRDAVITYLEAHFGVGSGYVHVALGKNPRLGKSGKYRTDLERYQAAFRWPEEAEKAFIMLMDVGSDVYVCPYLLRDTLRRKGHSVSAARRHVHADVDLPDGISIDLDKVRAIPAACVVGSGSTGNAHVYVSLTESVALGHHTQLCRALGIYLGTKDSSKCNDNDLLRPPGTRNYKPTVMNGGGLPPSSVAWLIEPTGERISPHTLAEFLGIELSTEEQHSGEGSASESSDEVEGVPDFESRFPNVYAAQRLNTGDRSWDTMRIAAACKANGLTLPQFRWVVAGRPDLMERLEGRNDDDLARVWERVTRQDADESEDFDDEVKKVVRKLRIHEVARQRFEQSKAGPVKPFDSGFVNEILARPPMPPFRIADILPMDSSMLVVAQRKTGKTTLMLNIAYALLTVEPFLGKYHVRPISGNVAILNFEVGGHQLARWAHDVGVPADRLLLINLRGVTNPLAQEESSLRLAEHLRENNVQTLIVDPFGRAFTGKDQNSPGEVGKWLIDLDIFARSEVGATDLILTAHAGWNGERTRGASALEDWPDSIVTMTLGNDGKQRYLRAIGRDVSVDEDLLSFDEDTRLLTMTGCGSRKNAADAEAIEELIVNICKYLDDNPGASTGAIQKNMKARQDTVRSAINVAEERGELRRVEGGQGKSTRHFRIDPNASITSTDSDSTTGSERSGGTETSGDSGQSETDQHRFGDA